MFFKADQLLEKGQMEVESGNKIIFENSAPQKVLSYLWGCLVLRLNTIILNNFTGKVK